MWIAWSGKCQQSRERRTHRRQARVQPRQISAVTLRAEDAAHVDLVDPAPRDVVLDPQDPVHVGLSVQGGVPGPRQAQPGGRPDRSPTPIREAGKHDTALEPDGNRPTPAGLQSPQILTDLEQSRGVQVPETRLRLAGVHASSSPDEIRLVPGVPVSTEPSRLRAVHLASRATLLGDLTGPIPQQCRPRRLPIPTTPPSIWAHGFGRPARDVSDTPGVVLLAVRRPGSHGVPSAPTGSDAWRPSGHLLRSLVSSKCAARLCWSKPVRSRRHKRGRSAAGSASPCQGEGRGFESRRPLERPRGFWWSGREARQRPAKPSTRVRIPSPPRFTNGRLAQW